MLHVQPGPMPIRLCSMQMWKLVDQLTELREREKQVIWQSAMEALHPSASSIAASTAPLQGTESHPSRDSADMDSKQVDAEASRSSQELVKQAVEAGNGHEEARPKPHALDDDQSTPASKTVPSGLSTVSEVTEVSLLSSLL